MTPRPVRHQPMWGAYIGLGANLGDAGAALRSAVKAIGALPACRLAAVSALYRSTPVEASGPDFLNAVIKVHTPLSASATLQALHQVESDHGRQRPFVNAPRTLDLDLLFHEQCPCSDTVALRLPHPRIAGRAFVLRPLTDIAPGLCLPGWGAVEALLPFVQEQGIVRWALTGWHDE